MIIACRTRMAAALLMLVATVPVKAQRVGVFEPGGSDVSALTALFARDGYNVSVLSAATLAQLGEFPLDMLVIPQDATFPHEARRALSGYLGAGGSLICLEPTAFDTRRQLTSPVFIARFDGTTGNYTIRKPGGAVVDNKFVTLPGGERGLELSTSYIGAGELMIEIPLASYRGTNRNMLRFTARGSHWNEILYLRILDTQSREWITYVDLQREWRTYEIPIADFMPRDATLQAQGATLDPARAGTLRIGMANYVLWPEKDGSFAIGPVELGQSDRFAGVPSAELQKWRIPLARFGVAYPAWALDPFQGSERIGSTGGVRPAPGQAVTSGAQAIMASGAWTIPPPPHERGREDADLYDILKRDELRRIPLLTAEDAGGASRTVAEIRFVLGEGHPHQGASLALFGLEGADYGAGGEAGELLARTADFMLRRPRIIRYRTNTGNAAGGDGAMVRCEVEVVNPGGATMSGSIEVDVGDGMLGASQAVQLSAGERRIYTISLGAVPEEFAFERFDWRISLKTAGGVDLIEDSVDLERTLIEAALYMMRMQERFPDGRMSNHYFSDAYGMRVLHALGRRLDDPEVRRRHAMLLEGRSGEEFKAAAYRFGDMLLRRQYGHGGWPMGYHEHRDMVFIADNGTIALGLAQLASWLAEPRRAEYLRSVRRYLGLRKSFRITEEKARQLEATYGVGSSGITVGDYGLGFMISDYYSGASWGELRREERGPSWVFTISMGVPGAMLRLDDDPEHLATATSDTHHFLDSGYTAASYFQAECAFWLYYTLHDPELRGRLMARVESDSLPAITTGRTHDWFELNGRRSLSWLVPVYYRRHRADLPEIRAALLKIIWEACSSSNYFSIAQVSGKYAGGTYGPYTGAYRYAALSAMWMMEMLDPGSTLLSHVDLPSRTRSSAGDWTIYR